MDSRCFADDLLNRAEREPQSMASSLPTPSWRRLSELLVGAGEVDHLDLLSSPELAGGRQSLAVNGFAHDEQDKSISLVVMHFVGGAEVPTLTYTEASTALKSLEQFLPRGAHRRLPRRSRARCSGVPARSDSQGSTQDRPQAQRGCRHPLPAVPRDRRRAQLSCEVDWNTIEVEGTPLEFHIWDMQRFLQVHESRRVVSRWSSNWAIGASRAYLR